jgi:hypothetical protein
MIVFTPEERPFGLTYGQWTVKWWQWLVSIPMNKNPAADTTGENASVVQNDPNVWFLAGTFGGASTVRRCVIPAEMAVLFPVINIEVNPLERPDLSSQTDLIKHVKDDEDNVLHLEALLDSDALPIYRIQSDPLIFPLSLPENNCFGVQEGGYTQTSADGYWVFLKSLPVGKHHIYFAGSCSAGTRNVRADYHLNVE